MKLKFLLPYQIEACKLYGSDEAARVNLCCLLVLADADDHANGFRDAAKEDYFSLNVLQTNH